MTIVDVGEGRDVRVARDTVTVVTEQDLPPVRAVAHASVGCCHYVHGIGRC
jgi:hypothetical protein